MWDDSVVRLLAQSALNTGIMVFDFKIFKKFEKKSIRKELNYLENK